MDITTVAGRRSLEVRREPYWRAEGGAYLGFRCTGQNGIGAWIGRVGDGSKQHYQALGKFGDYREAAKALNAWLDQRQTNKSTGIANDSLTVVDACRIYLEWARMTKGEGRAIACPTNILEASVTVRASGKRKKNRAAPHRGHSPGRPDEARHQGVARRPDRRPGSRRAEGQAFDRKPSFQAVHRRAESRPPGTTGRQQHGVVWRP